VIAIGAPRQVPRVMKPADIEAWQRDMAADMKRLFIQARESLRGEVAA